MNFKTTLSGLFLTLLLILGAKVQAQSVDCQFVASTNSCDSDQYCVVIQIASQDGADLIGSSSVRFSYDASVINFSGTSMDGVTVGSYESINFDLNDGTDPSDPPSDECSFIPSGLTDPISPYTEHSYDGGTPGDFLITWVLSVPTLFGTPPACPDIAIDWEDVAEVCFDVLDPDGDPNLTFSGDENGPVVDLTGTNYNNDTDPPVKYDNGSFGEMHMTYNDLCGPSSGNGSCSSAIALELGTTLTGDNTDAGDSGDPAPGCAFYQGDDVWFSVTLPASGGVVVTTSDAGGFTDSGMEAYAGSCGTLTFVTCNDDGGEGLFSQVSLSGNEGDVFYLRVWEFGGDNPGAFNITAVELIAGCTDADAENYNPDATEDDGSCEYILGCTNPDAENYNPDATQDDGSCAFAGSGACALGVSYLTFDVSGVNISSLCDGSPANAGLATCIYGGEYHTLNSFMSGETYCFISNGNYVTIYDDLTGDALAHGANEVCLEVTSEEIFMQVSLNDGACGTDTECKETYIRCDSCPAPACGCTDPIAGNYDPDAELDDGSCEYVDGCTDASASNYNPDATQDDGSCEYNVPANDECDGAIVLASGINGPFGLQGATANDADILGDCFNGGGTNTVWFTFDGDGAVWNLYATGDNGDGTSLVAYENDLEFQIFRGSCDDLILLQEENILTDGDANNINGCGQDQVGDGNDPFWQPQYAFSTVSGATYTVIVDIYGASVDGAFNLGLEEVCTAESGELALADGSTSTSICVDDGVDEPIDVQVVDAGQGQSGAWVITDLTNTILGLPDAPPFTIDGAGEGQCLIWWLTWDGDLSETPTVGANALSIVSDSECAALSNAISVTREAGCGDGGGNPVCDAAPPVEITISSDCDEDTGVISVGFSISGGAAPDDGYTVTVNGNEIGNSNSFYTADYVEPSSFSLEVTATDLAGCSSTETFNIDGCAKECDAEAGTIVGAQDTYCSGQDINVTADGFFPNSQFAQVYLLTSGDDNVIDYISLDGSFSGVADGDYCIIPFNYVIADAPMYEVGMSINDLILGCSDLADTSCVAITVANTPLQVDTTTTCDPLTQLHSVTFVISGGTDNYTIQVDDGAPADVTGGVAVLDFPLNTTVTITVTDAQTGCSFVGTYEFESCAKECDANAGTVTADADCDGNLTIAGSDFQTGDIYSQAYLLTESGSLDIVAISATGDFGDLNAGSYCVFPFNYVADDIEPQEGQSLTILLAQDACFAIGVEACFDYYPGLTITEEDVCNDDTGEHDVTYTFSGGSGNYTLQIDDGTPFDAGSTYSAVYVQTSVTLTLTDAVSGCSITQEYEYDECVKECDASAGTIDGNEDVYCTGEAVDGIFSTGFQQANSFQQVYILTQGTDYTIIAFNTDGNFGVLEAGDYCLHGLNYVIDDGNPIDGGVGQSLSEILSAFDQSVCLDFDLEDCTPITVSAGPEATASNDGPICDGEEATLNASGGATYSWTGPDGFASDLQSPTTTVAGEYTVTVTDEDGCENTASTTVEVSPAPEATASNTGPVCEGESVTLAATGGTSYSWTGPGGFISNQQNPEVAASGDYTVTVSNEAGCEATATTTVTINPNPEATASNDGPVCEGGSVTLSAGGGTSYSWTGPNGFTSNEASPTVMTAGEYTVTVTDANDCTDTATTTVAINPEPTATASNDGPVCEGETVTLSAEGGASYSWTGPNGFTSSEQNPTVAEGGEYTVTVSSGDDCEATATTTVVINPNPEATASNDGPVCEGGSVTLSASGGVEYSWSGPNGFVSSEASPTVMTAGIYNVTVTDANGCTDDASTEVVINPNPDAQATGGSICEGGSITLGASGGVEYSWTGPNGFVSSEQNPTVSTAGEYTVTVTDENGCMDTATATVVVDDSLDVSASNDGPACEGDPVMLVASGAESYSWTGPNGFVSSEASPTVTVAGTYTVVGVSGDCEDSASTEVVINPNPEATAEGGETCEDGSVTLSADGGTSYSWTGPNGFLSGDQNPTVSESGEYTVTVTDENGCTDTATATVVINEDPEATATADDDFICLDEGEDTIELSASGAGDGGSYSWTGPNGFISTDQNPTITDVSLDSEGDYTVTVTDANGCMDTETVNVQVDDMCVPLGSIGDTVFHDDDQDGVQDAGEEGLEGITVNLYDEDGNLIATTETDENGNYSFDNLPEGTYTVEVDVNDPDLPDDYILTTDGTDTVELGPGEDYVDADFGFDAETITECLPDAGELVLENPDDCYDEEYDFLVTAEGQNMTDGLYNHVWVMVGTDGIIEEVSFMNGTLQNEHAPDTYEIYSYTHSVDCEEPGFGDDWAALLAACDCYDTDGPITVVVEESCEELGSIGDTVFHDDDQDGVQDAGEEGLEGITVNLYDEDGNLIATTETDENGNYLFDNLPEGTYVVEVDANDPDLPEDYELTTDGTDTVELDEGEDYVDADFGFDAETPVTCAPDAGTLVLENPADCYDQEYDFLVTAEGNNMGDEYNHVWVMVGSDGIIEEVSFMNGTLQNEHAIDTYEIYSYTHSVDCDEPSFGDNWAELLANCDCDDTDGPVVVTLDPENCITVSLGSIGNFVWHDDDQDGNEDGAGEEGLANITVNLYDEDGNLIATTETDEDGFYLFDDLPEGTYVVEVDANDPDLPEDYELTTSGTDTVDLGPGEDYVDADFGFDGPDTPPTCDADAGTLVLENPADCYDVDYDFLVTAEGNNMSDEYNHVWVMVGTDGIIEEVSFMNGTLQNEHAIDTYEIYSYTHSIDCDEPSFGDNWAELLANCDCDDTDGPIVVTLDPENCVTILPGSIGDTVFHDDDQDGIQDAGEEGLEGITVNLYDEDGNLIATTETDENGTYLFDDLDEGTYVVEVDANDPDLPEDYELTTDGTDTVELGQGEDYVDADFGFDGPDTPPTCDADAGTLVLENPADCYDVDYDFLVTAEGNNMSDEYNHVWVMVGTDGIIEEVSFMNGTLQNEHAIDTYEIYSYTHSVDCDEPGFGDNWAELLANCDCDDTDGPVIVTLEDCTTTPPTPLGSIGNFVWHDDDQDGNEDGAGEEGLADITVFLYDEDGNLLATTETDEDGFYLFDDLPAGNYTVVVDANDADLPEGYELTTNGEDDVELGPGEDYVDADFGFDGPDTPPTPTLCEPDAGTLVLQNPDDCYDTEYDFLVTAAGNNMSDEYNHVWVMVGTDGIIEEVSFMNGTLQNEHAPDTYQIYSYTHSVDCDEPGFGDNWNDLLENCDCEDIDGPIVVVVDDNDCITPVECEPDAGTLVLQNPDDCYDTEYDFLVTAAGNNMSSDYNHVWVMVGTDGIIEEVSFMNGTLQNEHAPDTYQIYSYTHSVDCDEPGFGDNWNSILENCSCEDVDGPIVVVVDENNCETPDPTTPVCEADAGNLVLLEAPECIDENGDILVGAPGALENDDYNHVWVMVGADGIIEEVSFMNGTLQNEHEIGSYEIYSYSHSVDCDEPGVGDDWSDIIADCACQDIDGPVSVEVEDCTPTEETPPPPTTPECGADAGNLVLTNPNSSGCYTEDYDFIVTAEGNNMSDDFNHVWVMVGTDGIIEEVSFMNGTLQNYHAPDTYEIYSYTHDVDCDEPNFGGDWSEFLADCDCDDVDGPITVVVTESGDCPGVTPPTETEEGDGTITGHVFEDLDGDGVQDDDEDDLAGIVVNLYDEDGNFITSTLTDEEGDFVFTNLPPGSYTVVIDGNENNVVYTGDIDDFDDIWNTGDTPLDPDGGGSGTPDGDPNAGDFFINGGQNEFCSGEIIAVQTTGSNDSYSQVFVMTDGDDIVDVSYVGGIFTYSEPGNYTVYSLNYNADEMDAPQVGEDFGDYQDDADSDDYDVSNGISIEILEGITIDIELGEECDDEAGTYDVTVTFNGGSGDYTVIDGDISGNYDEGESTTVVANENTTFSVTVMDESGCTSTAEIYLANCTKTAIELISFYGSAEKEGNELFWATASEYNSDVFEVQRSEDGVNFKAIGEVNAAGNSNTRLDYNFMDVSAPAGISYYRLVEKDLDGNTTPTHVITLDRTQSGFGVISVAPVPAMEQVNIEFTSVITDEAVITIYDVAGRMLSVAETAVTKAGNVVTVDLDGFASGTYFLSVSTSETMATAKFIKQ